jgi:hypothetical protein
MKRILISAVVGMAIGLVLGVMLGHKLPPTQEQVVEFVGQQNVRDMAAFNKKLMMQWGMQVYQPQVLPTAPPVPIEPPK